MDPFLHTFQGKLWKSSPTASSANNFFHAAFGTRSDEAGEYFDKHARAKRFRWAAFLVHFQNEAKPPSLINILRKCSIEDEQQLETYITDVSAGVRGVTVEEIPVLAALENTQIVVLTEDSIEPLLVAKPDTGVLGEYRTVHNTVSKVVLSLKGNNFFRLLPVEDCTTTLNQNEGRTTTTSYSKGGSAGSKGTDYQVSLLVVILLNALRKFHTWRLSTENNKAGKFDDAVLEWAEQAILVQAKHKENKTRITKNELMSVNSKKNDFSLPKYFLSYEGIKKNFKDIRYLIICTNANVHEEVLTFCNKSKTSSDNILHHKTGDCLFYAFNDTIISELKENIVRYYRQNNRNIDVPESVITHENIKQFLEHLQIYFNYPPQDKMTKVVEDLLSGTEYSNKINAVEISSKLRKWFQQKDGEYFSETHATAAFAEILSDRYFQTLQRFDVSFKGPNFVFEGPTRIVQVKTNGQNLMHLTKIFHALQTDKTNTLCSYPDDGIDIQKQVVESFQLPCYKFLIVIWSSDGEETAMVEICNKLHEILDKYEYKRIILLSDHVTNLIQQLVHKHSCKVIKDIVTLQDLSRDSQERLLRQKNVTFQGTNVGLAELFARPGWKKSINLEILEKLVRGSEIAVGYKVPSLDDHIAPLYVSRTFESESTEGNQTETKFRIIFEDYNVNPYSFEEVVKKKEGSRSRSDLLSEEEIYNATGKVFLLQDDAGTGKSTVLIHLATVIKKKYPRLWVISIKLSDFTNIFSDFKERKMEAITLAELLKSHSSTTFTNQLEELVFLEAKKVVLLLDGVDEISPDYTGLVLSLLTRCQKESNFAKVIVSTRPHLAKKLRETLNVKSFTLQPLTREEQINFLSNYWCHKLRVDGTNREKCKRYADELLKKIVSWTKSNDFEEHFTGVPLHVMMLAEIFEENSQVEALTDYDGCKEFLNEEKETPKLPNKLSIAKIYEIFFKRKGNIFRLKGNPNGNPSANSALNIRFGQCMVFHRRLALQEILQESECGLFSDFQQKNESMEEIFKIGIVQRAKDQFYFSHRTFAEYFVAESITNQLRQQEQHQEEEFQRFFFDQVLSNPKFKVIRTFLNSFLQAIVTSLPSNIFRCYQSSSYLYTNYDLIHQLAKENCIAILHLFFKCINFKIVKSKEAKIHDILKNYYNHSNALKVLEMLVRSVGVNIKNERDETPLLIAIKAGSLEMAQFLVKHGANISEHILYDAIFRDQVDVVTCLLKETLKSGGSVNNNAIIPYTFAYLGWLDQLTNLVENGFCIKSKIKFDETLIFAAARGGQLETIRYLVQQGVDINSRESYGNTALHFITDVPSRIKTVKLLVELGINVNAKNSGDWTAFYYAIKNLDMVKLLIQCGTDVNSTNDRGETVLWESIWENQTDTIRFLVDHGCDVNIKNCIGRTALHLAAELGKLEVVEYFLNNRTARVDVNVTCDNGITPLFLAAAAGRLNTTEYLVEFGADVNKASNEGKTALDIATLHGHTRVVGFLMKHVKVKG